MASIRAEFIESFMMALRSIAAHKLRSALTLLGIMVGVFSIIVVMTTVRAMQHEIESNLSSLGGETFYIDKSPGFQINDTEQYWRRKDITLRQATELQERLTLPRCTGLEADFGVNEISSDFGSSSHGVSFEGDSIGSFQVQNRIIDEGRIFQESDIEMARDVCVLGARIAKDLFPFGSALDQTIKVDSIKYVVVGVLEAQGTMSGGNQDNFAVIPITTAMNRYGSRWHSVRIMVQAADHSLYDETVDQVRSTLRVLRKIPPGGKDDFEINSNDSTMEKINAFTFTVRMGVAAISSIALLAAGIGIMNIMLVSVTERTREIGIRRAIGAKKRNIMTQFVMEAVVLCELGGAVGVVLGVIGGDIGAHFLELQPVIPYDWAFYGLLICSIVGVIFGTYPAYKAANLDPIESLRYE